MRRTLVCHIWGEGLVVGGRDYHPSHSFRRSLGIGHIQSYIPHILPTYMHIDGPQNERDVRSVLGMLVRILDAKHRQYERWTIDKKTLNIDVCIYTYINTHEYYMY